MRQLLPTTWLSTLLLSTLLLGCSKKDDATPLAPPAPNTGSYKIDGQLVSCPAKIYETLAASNSYLTNDELQLEIVAPTTAISTMNYLNVIFTKPPGSAASAYTMLSAFHIGIATAGQPAPQQGFVTNLKFTLSRSAAGAYSGTFSGTCPATSARSSSVLTEGVFTDVQL